MIDFSDTASVRSLYFCTWNKKKRRNYVHPLGINMDIHIGNIDITHTHMY